ncbi:MAG TPA: hypothetical protein VFB26_00220 [Gaiellaceae bacterium]|nr:hypothetical protein [Gaiellaceae bacterium]
MTAQSPELPIPSRALLLWRALLEVYDGNEQEALDALVRGVGERIEERRAATGGARPHGDGA